MSEETRTITFQPEEDVKTMLERATGESKGRSPRGLKTYLINKALREWLKNQGYARKKESMVP